ncbi:MAG TPA: hypothetical protein VH308_11585 [Terracidiphilus sp.]|nr:hypothetical protein [Terracidiphilus sp.]
MSLTSIVQEIERRAEGREIGQLQEIRKELHGFQRLPGHSIFHPDSIKKKNGYAFHYGGRKELQFNIGYEGDMFRHGVAFSFEPSRTLPKIELLVPKVIRFNELLRLYPQRYSDLLMWHSQKGVRSTDYPPTHIAPELIRRGNFVFMGWMQPSEFIDYDRIVDDFDRLLPLYRFVEGSKTFPEISVSTNGGFRFESGCTPKPFSTTATVVQREVDIRLRHNEIEIALHRHLSSIHGDENVRAEIANVGGQVDVVVRKGDRFWFYEIKTAISARGCIREALAQLLEYSFWPGAQMADKLVIVGEPVLDKDSQKYLATLRQRFAFPLEYRRFDLAGGRFIT